MKKGDIPFFGLDRQYATHKNKFLEIANEALSSGQVLQGPAVEAFEGKLAALCGRRFARAVGSCTDALAFAMICCGVNPGDEVLVTAFSFAASVSPIIRLGAVPVFVDIEPKFFMMDLADAEKKATPRTKFLLAVHLFGQCLDAPEVEKFAARHGLKIIEDAAQALGSSFAGKPAGSLGEASCVSFDPTKVVGAFGSGGAVLTDSPGIAARVGRLRYHGKDPASGEFVELGYNSQLSTESAAMLAFKLDQLPQWAVRRGAVARRYIAGLGDLPGVVLPALRPGSASNWHKFVVKTERRDEMKKRLAAEGIQTMVHYPAPLCDLPYVRDYVKVRAEVPVTRAISEKTLTLPSHPELTDSEIDRIIAAVRDFEAPE